ncbi:hypothetical protein [Sphingomonas sp. VNH70]|uniref:hypothetical protein n=1 Tax=Sphingomonas silueang TaxID=3156617 RepID=UPI0032B5E723
MRHAVAAIIAIAVAGCSGTPPPASPGAPVAIYSPPVRPGGRGGMIFLTPAVPAARATSLEPPDPVPQPPTAAWLHGIWLLDARAGDVARVACNSGTTVRYDADGTMASFDTNGRWQLVGDRLTETVVAAFDGGAEPAPVRERPQTVRLRRVGPDEGAARSGGRWRSMLRCRPGDIPR